MSYHAPHNLRSHIARAATIEVHKNVQGQVVSYQEKDFLQTFYNVFAEVVGYLMVWGTVAAIGYHFAPSIWQAFKVWLGIDLL